MSSPAALQTLQNSFSHPLVPSTRPIHSSHPPKNFNIQTPSFFQRHDHLPSLDQVNAFRSLYLYISPHTYIGKIAKGPLYDGAINDEFDHEAGPFGSVAAFHAWFTALYLRRVPDLNNVPDHPLRHEVADDYAILFTHGDLHRSNILISTAESVKLRAIIDWEQSG
jgi:thiamine kinase-like enzyme